MNQPVLPKSADMTRFVVPPMGTVTAVVASLVAEGEALEQLQRSLSKEELARQDRFIPPVVKRRFGVCRGKLRHLLSAMLRIEPSDVQFEYNSTGKPRLASCHRSTLEFNVSHSGDWGLFGFADAVPLGVDTELFQRKTNFEALAPQVPNLNERARLALLPPEDRNLAIMHAWVAKEAVLKAIGVGIGFGLHAAEFPMPQPQVCTPLRIDPMLLEKIDDDANCRMNAWIDAAMWRVHRLDALPEGLSAVACPSSIRQVNVESY